MGKTIETNECILVMNPFAYLLLQII